MIITHFGIFVVVVSMRFGEHCVHVFSGEGCDATRCGTNACVLHNSGRMARKRKHISFSKAETICFTELCFSTWMKLLRNAQQWQQSVNGNPPDMGPDQLWKYFIRRYRKNRSCIAIWNRFDYCMVSGLFAINCFVHFDIVLSWLLPLARNVCLSKIALQSITRFCITRGVSDSLWYWLVWIRSFPF